MARRGAGSGSELGEIFAHLRASLRRDVPSGKHVPLQRKIPLPVPAFVGAFVTQQLLTKGRAVTPASMGAAGMLIGIATEIGWSSLAEFHRRQTSPSPLQPEAASKLVTTGANAYTRNPMYLAMALVLAAGALARRSPRALAPLSCYLAAVQHWQIRAEEDALTVLFGEAYTRYCRDVPRWFGWRSVKILAAPLRRQRASQREGVAP